MNDSFALAVAAYDLAPPVTLFELPGGANNTVVGLHTGAGDFVLKKVTTHTDPAALHYEHQLLRWLATQSLSFAVPMPLATRVGELFWATAAGSWLLLPYLSGRRPDYTQPEEMTAVGAALAELHITLAHYPMTPHPNRGPYAALDEVHPAVPAPATLTPAHLGLPSSTANEEALAWWREEVARLQSFCRGPYQELPQQVIHSDFGHSNTLYADGRITAIIDFEFAAPDVRVMDLASALYFGLRIWENPQPLLNGAALVEGYARHIRLTPVEIAALPWLIRLRNAVSTIWWFGRALAGGANQVQLTRLEDMQAMVAWLERHSGDLVKLFTYPTVTN
ncbi:MAG: phosphotransferase [Caldilineaceae bacterium]